MAVEDDEQAAQRDEVDEPGDGLKQYLQQCFEIIVVLLIDDARVHNAPHGGVYETVDDAKEEDRHDRPDHHLLAQVEAQKVSLFSSDKLPPLLDEVKE